LPGVGSTENACDPWFLWRQIAAFERTWNYNADYVREAIDADPLAFLAFGKAIGIGKNRKDVPKTAHYAAGIVTVMAEDCGPCTQLAIDMAERGERMGSATMLFAMSVDANQQTFARRLSEVCRSPQPVSVRWIVPTFGVGIGVSVATAVGVAVTGRGIAVAVARVATAAVKNLRVHIRRIRKWRWIGWRVIRLTGSVADHDDDLRLSGARYRNKRDPGQDRSRECSNKRVSHLERLLLHPTAFAMLLSNHRGCMRQFQGGSPA
jgi:hypothetical protein